MPQEPISVIQDAYAAFGRGDVPAILDKVEAGTTFEVVGPRGEYPLFEVRTGREGVAEFFRLVDELEEFSDFTPLNLTPAGDQVLVQGRAAYTIRKTGKPVATDWVHVFTVRDGKITSFREFSDSAQIAQAYRG